MLAVGSTVIDLTPTPVKEWAVAQFGTADKPILIGSVAIGTLLIAGGIGLVARSHRTLGLALLGALGMTSVLAALLRPASTSVDHAPRLRDGRGRRVPGQLVPRPARPARRLPTVTRSPVRAPTTPPTRDGRSDRRHVLAAAAGLGVVAAAGGTHRPGARPWGLTGGGDAPGRGRAADRRCRAGSRAPCAASPSFRTPNSEFYRIDTALVIPRVSADGWKLTIDGDVERPYSLTFDELLRMPLIERDITLTCVSNEVGGPYVGGARWLGVRTKDLLERAGITPGRRPDLQPLHRGHDHLHPGAGPDRRPRGARRRRDERRAAARPMHGFPARLVTPGLYGFVGATKWLTRHPGHDLPGRERLLDRPRVGHRRAHPHPVTHRHPARAEPARCRPRRHRRRRLGAAARHREGRGARRRQRVAGGQARP